MWNTLRTRLTIILISLAIGPLMVAGSILAVRSFALEQERAIDLQSQVAQNATTEVEAYFQGVAADLNNIGNEIRNLENPDRAQYLGIMLNALNSVQYQDVYEELTLLDRLGREQVRLSSSEIVPSTELIDRSTTDEFTQVASTRDIYFSPVFYDEKSGIPSIIIALPLYKSRSIELSGVLIAKIRFTLVGDLIADSKVGADQTLYITNLDGNVVAHQDRAVDLMASKIILQGKAGRQAGLDGTSVILASHEIQLGEQSLKLVAEKPASKALELANTTIITITIIIVISLLIAVFLGFLTVRQIVQPIEGLAKTAAFIASGDFSQKASAPRNDEIGTLANAFNSMTTQLRDLIGSLEQRVEERTKALSSVAEVGTAVSTILETDKLLQQVVDLTKERFDFYHTHIYLLNDAGDTLVLAAGAGEPGRQMVAEGRSIPLDREQSLVARAARERKGITVNDVTTAPDFLPHPLLPDTRSELAVPMLVGEEVVGVFDVQSDIVGRFTDADIAVQTTLASQVATSVQNARSYTTARDAQQLTRSVIDSTDDWIFIKDQDHRYRLVNQGYANSLHIPIADFIGKNDLELGFPEELVKGNPEKGIRGFWADDRAVMDGGVAKQIPDDFVTIDGNIRVFDTVKVPLRDADNKVWGVLAFARDMTERRNLEELNRRRAQQQESLNLITQRIQGTTNVEAALQIAARELGHALGQKRTLVALDMANLAGENKVVVNE